MDAGCNLRYILSNALEAQGRWWKSYNSGFSCLPPKAQEDTIWPTPTPPNTNIQATSFLLPRQPFVFVFIKRIMGD